jgi:4-hydroxyphenylacetate 3-hydroxylase-like protein
MSRSSSEALELRWRPFASRGRCHYDPGMPPFTGQEFLDSLRDGREVWIYGQRVADVTAHPAFRNPARMLAPTTRCTTPSSVRF